MFKKCLFICLLILTFYFVSCSDNENTSSDVVTQIDDFYFCDAQEGIAIKDFGDMVFLSSYDNHTESFALPETFSNGTKINWVGEGCFSNDIFIKNVIIPDGYEGIDMFSFYNCENLETVHIGKDVNYIGDSVFFGCDRVFKFTVSEKNPHFYSASGCVLSKSDFTLYASNGQLPRETKRIYHSVFRGRKDLTSLNIHEGITYIGASAFADSSLNYIQLPDSLVEVEQLAFAGTKIGEIYIPENVKTMHRDVFHSIDGIVINCAAESKPEGWDDEWLGSCTNYTVNWGVSEPIQTED